MDNPAIQDAGRPKSEPSARPRVEWAMDAHVAANGFDGHRPRLDRREHTGERIEHHVQRAQRRPPLVTCAGRPTLPPLGRRRGGGGGGGGGSGGGSGGAEEAEEGQMALVHAVELLGLVDVMQGLLQQGRQAREQAACNRAGGGTGGGVGAGAAAQQHGVHQGSVIAASPCQTLLLRTEDVMRYAGSQALVELAAAAYERGIVRSALRAEMLRQAQRQRLETLSSSYRAHLSALSEPPNPVGALRAAPSAAAILRTAEEPPPTAVSSRRTPSRRPARRMPPPPPSSSSSSSLLQASSELRHSLSTGALLPPLPQPAPAPPPRGGGAHVAGGAATAGAPSSLPPPSSPQVGASPGSDGRASTADGWRSRYPPTASSLAASLAASAPQLRHSLAQSLRLPAALAPLGAGGVQGDAQPRMMHAAVLAPAVGTPYQVDRARSHARAHNLARSLSALEPPSSSLLASLAETFCTHDAAATATEDLDAAATDAAAADDAAVSSVGGWKARRREDSPDGLLPTLAPAASSALPAGSAPFAGRTEGGGGAPATAGRDSSGGDGDGATGEADAAGVSAPIMQIVRGARFATVWSGSCASSLPGELQHAADILHDDEDDDEARAVVERQLSTTLDVMLAEHDRDRKHAGIAKPKMARFDEEMLDTTS